MAVTSGSFPSLLLDEQGGNGEREKREKEGGGTRKEEKGERERERERKVKQGERFGARESRPVGDARMGRERGWRVRVRAAGGSIRPFVLLSPFRNVPPLRNVYREMRHCFFSFAA